MVPNKFTTPFSNLANGFERGSVNQLWVFFPQQFLAFNPSRRISAFDALSHPYFQSVDSHSRSVYAAQPIPSNKPTMEERTA